MSIDPIRAFMSRHQTAILLLLAVAALGYLLLRPARPPQMGTDDDVFNTVDALFTGVTSRDERLLAKCEQRLVVLKDAGKLPVEASDYLDGIVRNAHAGRWQSAAEGLYEFMKAQRREGTLVHSPRKDQKRGSVSRKSDPT